MLKTLEEPPNASTSSSSPPRPTRCCRRSARAASGCGLDGCRLADVAEVLIARHEYAEADAHAAASLSDGSVGRALEGGSEEFVEARSAALQLLETVADDPPPARRIMGAMNLPGADGAKRTAMRSDRACARSPPSCRDLGRSLARRRTTARWPTRICRPKLQRLLRSFDNDRMLRAFAAVDRALNALDRNASPEDRRRLARLPDIGADE